jgi:hypothetical protein
MKAFITLILATCTVIATFGQVEKGPSKKYNLDLQINPASGYINCSTEIRDPRDSVFFLARGMRVSKVEADHKSIDAGKAVAFLPDSSLKITLTSIPVNIEICYSGRLLSENFPKTISSLNMVRADLIELSDQIKWYPVSASDGLFDYNLRLSLPSDFVVITNSILSSNLSMGDRVVTSWKSAGPVWNISLVAAPGLKTAVVTSCDIPIEIYYSRLPGTYIDSIKNDVAKAYGMLAGIYGSKGACSLVRLVYSPRPAGGYARSPMIIVSENFALDQRNQPYGYERDLRLNIHEMAHCWSTADASSTEDWLNEGMAEFLALMISENISGKEFYRLLIDEYRGIVTNSDIRTAIVDTQGNSGEREINRYYKPALFLDKLWRTYGDDKLRLVFSSFYASTSQSGNATTALFLDEIEKFMGRSARDSVNEVLTLKKRTDDSEDERSDSKIEPCFLGTWKGKLSQFGSEFQFVLNIVLKNDLPFPSLDSPDQEATNIQVTAMHANADSISFRVPVASGSYRGILDRSTMILTGSWNQRGIDYPLVLRKSDN